MGEHDLDLASAMGVPEGRPSSHSEMSPRYYGNCSQLPREPGEIEPCCRSQRLRQPFWRP